MESGGGVYSADCGLHQLLRDAHGSAPRCNGASKIQRIDASERRKVGLDWKSQTRCEVVGNSEAWSKPRKVFVNSMSDLFHADVPSEFIARVWQTMKQTPRHTYQILTKRPDRMAEVLSGAKFEVLPNVWLGTSVEDGRVLSRLDDIRRVPAAIRFVSLEPLIGSVAAGDLTNIHWAIVGGESGPRARAMNPEWVDEIEMMCRQSNTAFFFKQWGGKNKKAAGRLLRGRTFDEMPVQISP